MYFHLANITEQVHRARELRRIRVREGGWLERAAKLIADRGIGLERRELRRIFQRFYQASRDVQRQAQGIGLGLFVVRQLVRRQGGSVQARSDGPGRGSRFTVTLRTPPKAPHESSAQAELASPPSAPPAEPRWR